MTDVIKVTFIIPKNCRNENDCSEDMQLAFTSCEQHSGGGLQAQWVHENDWKQFEGLTKQEVFVLSEFNGDLYEKLRGSKCLLVGPRCLSCCLIEGKPIPSGPEPIFTVGMRGLVVTASGLTKQKKENIRKKIHWMGGLYSSVLTDDSTHLISDTVISDKYTKSVEKGIPVMSETWVEAVWEASLHLNVNGSSSEFDAHRLPTFANLQVTTSGISKKDKQMITKLINENGGVFSGAFQSETTDVVIMNNDGVRSEKYKAAIEYGKACVLPTWVKDSAARGVALPLAQYRVVGASTSSPLTESRLPDMSLNFSRITNLRVPSNFVDETRAADLSTMSGRMKFTQETKKSNDSSVVDKEVQAAFENFDMSSIKKAGPIFDGFCIWLTGLEGVCRERAAAIVSRCGGVRYDCPHERVTHVAAGTRAAAAAAARALPAAPLLRPTWLLDSVRDGRPRDEIDYILELNPTTPAKSSSRKPRSEPESPMSKRNLQLLQRLPGPSELPPPPDPLPPPQDDIVNHYLSQNIPEPVREKTPEHEIPDVRSDLPDVTEDDCEDPTEEIEQIFRDVKIEVQGLDEESICEIGAEVSAAGGALVAAGAGGAYVLLPLDFDIDERLTAHAEPVTVFWVKDCLSNQELLPIQYYHRPVKIPVWGGDPGPLHGVVASLSTYSGYERAFLDEVAKLLGATTQLRFCRRNTGTALASTHLICPTPTGDKYLGAVKWGLPAVQASWLMECVAEARRVSEKPYLVGDTQAPPFPEPPQPMEENQPVEAEVHANDPEQMATDKENAMLPPAAVVVPRRGSVPSREQTPQGKAANEGENELSPASRYIAMARQGLLGGDSQETPKRLQDLKDQAKQEGDCAFRTPPLDDALSSPNLRGLSPTTRRRLQAVRRGEMPSDPIRTPTDPFEKSAKTPDSAFGAALRPGGGRMSPDARKRLWKVVSELPGKPADQARKPNTPLSEIRNRFLAQFNSETATPPSEHPVAPRKLHLQDQVETPPSKIAKRSEEHCAGGISITEDVNETEKTSSSNSTSSSSLPAEVDVQLQRLSAALSGRASTPRSRRVTKDPIMHAPGPEPEQPGPESQPNTVGWDDTRPAPPGAEPAPHPAHSSAVKKFMLSSNVDNREEIIEMIQYLGGEVCEGTELDPEATHLLCVAPGRSEKMLGSVAAGRWVLHPAYVARSRAHGSFLSEEEYEWGNPMATCLPAVSEAERSLGAAAHRWRAARAAGGPGPFAGVVALLHVPAPRRRLLARLVIAGDGRAPELQPPYTDDTVTVCFADIKRYPLSERDAAWLVSKRIPVCAPILLSSFLTEETPPKLEDHCLPDYRPK